MNRYDIDSETGSGPMSDHNRYTGATSEVLALGKSLKRRGYFWSEWQVRLTRYDWYYLSCSAFPISDTSMSTLGHKQTFRTLAF
jgi:hypothetical protein